MRPNEGHEGDDEDDGDDEDARRWIPLPQLVTDRSNASLRQLIRNSSPVVFVSLVAFKVV